MIQIAWIDPYKLIVWSYRNCLPELTKDTEDARIRTQLLVKKDWQHPNIEKWGVIKSTLRQVRKATEKSRLSLEIAYIEAMGATGSAWIPGEKDEFTVVMCLTSNPGNMLYEGLQPAVNPTPGSVLMLGGGPAMRCAANHGDGERLHLVLQLRREVSHD